MGLVDGAAAPHCQVMCETVPEEMALGNREQDQEEV